MPIKPETLQKKVEERKLITEKKCLKCLETKPVEMFRFLRKEAWTYHCYCKKCQNRIKTIKDTLSGKRKLKDQQEPRKTKKRDYIRKCMEQPEMRDKMRNRYLLKEYKLTLEEYEIMFKTQEGVCKICNLADIQKKLVVDHNHDTGAVRGLLCDSCNLGLGKFKDNQDYLQSAIEYLKETNTDKS